MFVWKDFDPVAEDLPVRGLQDILLSMRNYYNRSGGRVLNHFAAYVMIHVGKGLFNVLNALMFTVLGWLVYRLPGGERRSPLLLPVVYASLLLYLPAFGDDALWLCGAVNYLWPSVLLLFAVWLLQNSFRKMTAARTAAVSAAILLSAATNEITGGMLLIVMAVYAFCAEKTQRRFYYVPMLCGIPGILLILLSPGNAHRSAVVEGMERFSLPHLLEIVSRYCLAVCSNHILCLIPIGTACFLCRKYRCSLKTQPLLIGCALAGLAGTAALGVSGVYIPRPLFQSVLLLICAMWQAVRLFVQLRQEKDAELMDFLQYTLRSAWIVLLCAIPFCGIHYRGSVETMILIAAEIGFIALFLALLEMLVGKLRQQKLSLPMNRKTAAVAKRCLLPVCALALMVPIVHHTILYVRNVQVCVQYYDALEEQLRAPEQGDDVLRCTFPEKSRLFPDEANVLAEPYTVSWFAEYLELINE